VVRDPQGYEASSASDLTAPAALAATGVDDDHTAVVVTGDDGRNLLVAQHLRGRLNLNHVVVVLSDPRNRPAFDIPGVAVVCRGAALAEAIPAAVPVDVTPR
jgi:Trk K+ transport system NAD-binding subunit